MAGTEAALQLVEPNEPIANPNGQPDEQHEKKARNPEWRTVRARSRSGFFATGCIVQHGYPRIGVATWPGYAEIIHAETHNFVWPGDLKPVGGA
jgi:hypothetical protein